MENKIDKKSILRKIDKDIDEVEKENSYENIPYSHKIVVVGTGAFGTAISESLQRDSISKNNRIILYGNNSKEVNDINTHNKNSKYYSLKLSPKLEATINPEMAFNDADIIMLAVPSIAITTVIKEAILPNLTRPVYFVNLAKGFDYLKLQSLAEAIKSIVPKEKSLGVLKMAGASYASEVIEKEPTSFILACDDIEVSKKISKILSNKTMKVVPSNSIETIEWMSIIKNPLALLLGIVAGLGYKVNTRALFFTQATNDMRRLLKHLELDDTLIFSPAGIGDLYLTGTSRKSRNYYTGFQLGKADKVTKKLLSKFATVEGLRSVEVLLRISRKNKLNLKSIELLYNITYKGDKPSVALKTYLDKL